MLGGVQKDLACYESNTSAGQRTQTDPVMVGTAAVTGRLHVTHTATHTDTAVLMED